MNTVVRIKKRHALVGLMVGCSVAGFLFGFTAHAETVNGDTAYQVGESIQVETGLEDGYSTMDFTCLDTNYKGGYLFVSDDVIPYTLSSRYGSSDNDYTNSDARIWLNQYFADTLSVAQDILPVKLEETEDSISDRVFCLSIDEVKKNSYKAIARKTWSPQRGMRYYWTRSKRENTANQAYMVQYNGHIASSRVSLSEAGLRPAFVLGRPDEDVSQGKIWYEGDTQEREIHGKNYMFRCIDPNYCDAGEIG